LSTHLVIPDVQVKPNQDVSFLKVIGEYIVEKKPDVIICIGDFADLPSLSSYDVGKKSFEGRRYRDDVLATQHAMEVLLAPLAKYNQQALKNKKKVYRPRMLLTIGNHENRITRAVENDAKLDGTIGLEDLRYEQYGWEVHPFLDVVLVDGIAYSHYFTTGVMGRPVTSARALVTKKHISCVQGHNQKMEIYNEYKADGKSITGLFAGCCYQHNEDYLGPQGNNYFRGIHMLYDVQEGQFHCHSITLDYLLKRSQRRLRAGTVEGVVV
jgi:hypothetical protein